MNGTAVIDVNGHVVDVSPVSGTISFTIDSTTSDEVIPVIIAADTGSSDGTVDLDLNADNEPTDAFGLGGQKLWIPAEAASGQPLAAEGDFDVTKVNATEDYFIAEDDASAGVGTSYTFFYDDNDTFQIATAASAADGDSTSVCVQVTMATFEQNLSVADELDVSSNYNSDPAFTSTFCLEDLNPAAPTNVNATASGNDVTVTWTGVATATSYNVYRATDPTPADACPEDGGTADIAAASYANVGTVPATSATFTEQAVPNGTYCYAVTAVSGADESALTAGASDEDQVTTPVADVTAPTAVANASVVDTDTGFDGVPDTGDVLRVYFDEAITLNNPALRVADGDGDTDTIDSSNATFVADGSVLTITLTAALADDATGSGTNDGLDYPLTITNRSGITDAAGNGAVLTDNTLEDDGPEFFKDTATTGNTTFTITFNEALNQVSAETEANYSYDPDGAGVTVAEVPVSAVLGADGRTVTLTVTTAVAASATVDPAVTLTDTEGQGATQGATAIN